MTALYDLYVDLIMYYLMSHHHLRTQTIDFRTLVFTTIPTIPTFVAYYIATNTLLRRLLLTNKQFLHAFSFLQLLPANSYIQVLQPDPTQILSLSVIYFLHLRPSLHLPLPFIIRSIFFFNQLCIRALQSTEAGNSSIHQGTSNNPLVCNPAARITSRSYWMYHLSDSVGNITTS
ncbi:hypothetical protein ACTXT7_005803 [Hymenolepis weldensis]